jgi:hypothetical protein
MLNIFTINLFENENKLMSHTGVAYFCRNFISFPVVGVPYNIYFSRVRVLFGVFCFIFGGKNGDIEKFDPSVPSIKITASYYSKLSLRPYFSLLSIY